MFCFNIYCPSGICYLTFCCACLLSVKKYCRKSMGLQLMYISLCNTASCWLTGVTTAKWKQDHSKRLMPLSSASVFPLRLLTGSVCYVLVRPNITNKSFSWCISYVFLIGCEEHASPRMLTSHMLQHIPRFPNTPIQRIFQHQYADCKMNICIHLILIEQQQWWFFLNKIWVYSIIQNYDQRHHKLKRQRSCNKWADFPLFTIKKLV